MAYRPFVSVCVSTWERKEDLRTLFESLIVQDYSNYEVCIVDNASLDGTFHLVKEYEKKFSVLGVNVKYEILPTPNYNAIQTINRALRMGEGVYLLVMDDDVRFADRGVLSSLVCDMQSDPLCAVVGSHVKGEDGLSQLMLTYCDGNVIPDTSMVGSVYYPNFHGACALFNKEYMIRLGFYDESFVIYMNEMDLALKAIAKGMTVKLDLDAVVIHKGTVNMNACNKKAVFAIRNYNRVIRRNFVGVLKYKALILQTCMTFGFFAERILFWEAYKKRCIFMLMYRTLAYNVADIFRRQPKNVYKNKWNCFTSISNVSVIRERMYNSMKCSIMSRIGWSISHKSGKRGFR
jgi:GT2 family glycosyltransferase